MEDINRERILKAAHSLFNTRGYRSVTVQDLASELGMSKKTIYQYFDGKEEIATAVVEETMRRLTDIMNESLTLKSDPLLALKVALKEAFGYDEYEFLRIGPLFLMDIQKYLPDLAEKYKKFREEGKQVIETLLIKGKEMGLIKDIPIHLVMEILHESLHALIKPEFVTKQRGSMADVIDTFMDIFFSGIAVSKGLESTTEHRRN